MAPNSALLYGNLPELALDSIVFPKTFYLKFTKIVGWT